ncbi:MAG: tRNA dihydrouridine synthase DusB [Bacteroidales bacterium]
MKFSVMLSIGNTQLRDEPVLLAPMEDITDPSFRYMCKMFGADMMYTEFISSDGLIRDGRKSLQKLCINDQERPIGIQLYGHLIEPMLESVKIAEKSAPDVIDLNFGCPVKKIAARGAGAGMMKNPELMETMTRQIVQATKLPVTVKTRLGYDEENKNVLEIALRLQDAGIKALTIHGRTRPQMYKGTARWDLIRLVKEHPDIEMPVIGNGDINSGEMARAYFNKYKVDGIMIGRASIGRPWIFKEIRHFLDTGETLPPPAVAERVKIAKEHFERSLDYKGKPRGIFEMRKHFSLYFKGIPHFKPMRMKLVTSTDPEEIFQLLDEINTQYGDFRPENPYAYS